MASNCSQFRGADNDDGLIHYFHGAARTPPDAATADVTAISRQGVTDFYATIYQSYISQSNDLRRLTDRLLSLEAQLLNVTTTQDDALTQLESWRGRFDTMMQMTARLGVGGVNSGGGGALSKSHLKQHQPPLFTGDLKLETVNLFLRKVEHWVRQGGAAMGYHGFDSRMERIDSAWRVHGTRRRTVGSPHWIHQQGVMIIPRANGSYAPVTWPLVKSAFRHRFVPEVAITAVRKEICTPLRYSKEDVTYFNKRFSELIRMLQKETTITCEDPLYRPSTALSYLRASQIRSSPQPACKRNSSLRHLSNWPMPWRWSANSQNVQLRIRLSRLRQSVSVPIQHSNAYWF